MVENEHDNVTHLPDRRRDNAARTRGKGETTAFDLSAIQAARQRDEDMEPMFLVCRGVQKGRPVRVLDGNWTIGRGPVCDISLQGRGISRTHLRVESSPETGVVVTDAASTNGVFVNGTRIDRRALRDRDVVQLGPETVLRFMFAPACEMDLRVRQYENSIVDDLTGVHNRRYLMESMEHEMAFAVRHHQPLCLMLVDIDHFKLINDNRGHQAGDAVIKQLAERIADALRSEDIFARLGGEEFAVLTRGLDTASAQDIANRVRTLVETHPFVWQGAQITCTISVGGTMQRPKETLDASTLLKRADENLYRAKDAGRNSVIIG